MGGLYCGHFQTFIHISIRVEMQKFEEVNNEDSR